MCGPDPRTGDTVAGKWSLGTNILRGEIDSEHIHTQISPRKDYENDNIENVLE